MLRRSFIKHSSVAGLLTLVTPRSIISTLFKDNPEIDLSAFLNPPLASAPYTWWHWMNGNITRDGITRDLEAMKEIGLGGFQMFEAGSGIPQGTVAYLSDEWVDMVEHTISESQRLGLEFAMHNCPGWSSSGGPWITPELSMQQLTWSELVVKGGSVLDLALPKPHHLLDFYKDAALIAFPSTYADNPLIQESLTRVLVNGKSVDASPFFLDNIDLTIMPLPAEKQGALTFEFKSAVSLRSVTLLTSGSNSAHFVIQGSADGQRFEDISRIHGGGGNGFESSGDSLATATFQSVQSKYIRICFDGIRHFSSVRLSQTGRLSNWLSKGNYRNAGFENDSQPPVLSDAAIASGNIIDLTDKLQADGRLKWNVPPGEWTIIRFGHTAIGQQNHSAPTLGTGLDCDKFSLKAFDFHFQQMFNKLLPSLQRYGAKGKVGLLIDSYEMGLQNWTEELPSSFKRLHHYDLLNYLPVLTGRIVDTAEVSDQFLYDFRLAHAELMSANYYGRFQELCKQHQLITYTEPYSGGPFEEMQVGQQLDVPMGEFWAGLTVLWPNSSLQRTVKMASSIAHSKGGKVVGAESFTAEPNSGKWQQHPYAMKAQGDYMFTKGLTRLYFHRYAHQPHPSALPGMTMGPWGIHFERTNTWWKPGKAWIKYLHRCQFLLRAGLPVIDLAYFTGEDLPNDTLNPEEAILKPPFGFDYDLMNKNTLLHKVKMEKGRLTLPDGLSYSALILPLQSPMSLPVIRKLMELLQNGLKLIGKPPEKMAGLYDFINHEQEFKQHIEKLWPNNRVGISETYSVGKGLIYTGADLAHALQQFNILPDFKFTSASGSAPVNYLHRQVQNVDVYFIANHRRSSEMIFAEFRVRGKTPELWDADTGSVTPVSVYQRSEHFISFALPLDPSASVFVVFKPGEEDSGITSVERKGKQLLPISPFRQDIDRVSSNLTDSFAYTLWVKPEIDIALSHEEYFGGNLTDRYAVFPAAGGQLYGPGNAISGFTIGRNGIVLFERCTQMIEPVLFVSLNISGWTKVIIEYRSGQPEVFIHGKSVAKGKTSLYKVHPGLGGIQPDQLNYFSGDLASLKVLHPAEVPGSLNYSEPLPAPDYANPLPVEFSPLEGSRLLLWENGAYAIRNHQGLLKIKTVSGIKAPLQLNDNWDVFFPVGYGAPPHIKLQKLLSLHLHSVSGVKYFSGTATYQKSFLVPAENLTANKRSYLYLGRVEVMAAVRINGKRLQTLWKPPYRLDITDFIKAGKNQLEVSVTNLWPNRLIGDEQLPEENEYQQPTFPGKFASLYSGSLKTLPQWYLNGQPKPPGGRVTFTTWKHYQKDSPLLPSGLLGPVVIRTACLL